MKKAVRVSWALAATLMLASAPVPAYSAPAPAYSVPAQPPQAQGSASIPAEGGPVGTIFPGTVPVEFAGPEGYTIRALTHAGETAECVSPCILQLSPGDTHINVVGYFDQRIQVANRLTRARVSLRRTGWLVTGISLLVPGLLQGFYGAWLWSVKADEGGGDSTLFGKGLAFSGFAVAGAGVAAMMVGLTSSSEITVEDDRIASPTLPLVGRTSLGFIPQEGGGLVGASARF
jgi:hypothetical protein